MTDKIQSAILLDGVSRREFMGTASALTASTLVTSSLLAVLAQRLVRRTCKVCGGTGTAPGQVAHRCDTCAGTGFKGRLAVYEIMTMNDELRRLTATRADAVSLMEAAVASGFKSMREDAAEKVRAGLTTAEEVFRVLH